MLGKIFTKAAKNINFIGVNKFAQLKKAAQKGNFVELKDYYEYLIRITPSTEKGTMKFDSSHLSNMIQQIQTESDVELTISAYYNFLGHQCKFNNTEIDQLLLISLEKNAPNYTHDIIENHNYLMYYPHPDVTSNIMVNYLFSLIMSYTNKYYDQNKYFLKKYYDLNEKLDHAKDLSKKIRDKRLLQLNGQFFESLINILSRNQEHALVVGSFNELYKRKIQINQNCLNQVLYSFIQQQEQNQTHKHSIRIIEYINKQQENKSVDNQLGLCYLHLKSGELSKAIATLKDLKHLQKNQKISGSQMNKECLQLFIEQLQNSQQEIQFQSFQKAIQELVNFFGTDNIDGDILSEVQQAIQKFQCNDEQKKNHTQEI